MWKILMLNQFFSDCRYEPYLRRYSPTKLWDGAQMALATFGDLRDARSMFQTCILNLH